MKTDKQAIVKRNQALYRVYDKQQRKILAFIRQLICNWNENNFCIFVWVKHKNAIIIWSHEDKQVNCGAGFLFWKESHGMRVLASRFLSQRI